MAVEAFERVFLDAMRKSLTEVINDLAFQEHVMKKVTDALFRKGFSKGKVLDHLNDIVTYAAGSLAADIAIGAIMEGADEEQRLQKLVADVAVEAGAEKGISTLLKHCNIEAAKQRFGEDEVEKIAEKVTTTSIYDTDEFNQSCEGLKKVIKQALQ